MLVIVNPSVFLFICEAIYSQKEGLRLSQYVIPEVKGELVADVAKTLANSKKPLTLGELSKSYEGQFSSEYVREFMSRLVELNAAGLAKVLKRLSFLAQVKVYLFWCGN